ncbi:MAG TPA: serine/threonine-protein kinase [Polyangiaceae bacterium]|jgi:serine/threonine-protein kinase
MEAPVQPGDTLAGKYRVDRVLGLGGMGIVLAAFDLLLERRVAIKFLLSEGAQNPEVVARFAREARSAARIESEHVARVIDVGSLPGGAPYMVMEYLDGQDLARKVADHGALPIEDAVDYLLQACEAIAEAHALGIVHRDLKPANLFLTRRADGMNFVKVLDFGISKASAAAGSQPDMSLTKTAAVMGSPLYMAPEQMRSTRQVDARADVWALGVILYELVSGRVPFEATSMPELCAIVLTEAPPSLSERCPGAPAGLVAAVDRCLQKDPALRFANVSELANALAAFAPQKSRVSVDRISRVLRAAGVNTSSLAPAAPNSGAATARTGDSTSSAWSPATTAASRRSSALSAALAVTGLLLTGGVAAFLLRGHGSKQDSTAASNTSAPSVPAPTTANIDSSAKAPASLSAEVTPVPAPAAAASDGVAATANSAPSVVPAKVVSSPTPGALLGARHPLATTPKVSKPAPVAAAPPPPAAPAAAPPVKKRNPLDIGLK